MRDTLAHRGPDDAGIWCDPRGDVALGHRRLSILDLSDAGHQPMSNEDGTVWTVFNGEIYNYPDVRQILERRGHVFKSHTDTEVIVHAYEEFGVDCVAYFQGMFAICIFDTRSRRMVLLRDRLGVKPLYYFVSDRGLVFASEATALLEHPCVARDLEDEGLSQYLALGSAAAPMTLLRGIHKLAPAERMLVEADGTRSSDTYWTPFDGDLAERLAGASRLEIEEELLSRLRSSVQLRLRADVPVGVFLSGGLDSSTNVALVSDLVSEPVRTYSLAAEGHSDYDELPYARLVADAFHTQHHEVRMTQEEFSHALDGVVRHWDEPNPDSACIGTYILAQTARESGTPVIQLGEGADEIFHGYDNWHTARSLLEWVSRAPTGIRHAIAATSRRGRWLGPNANQFLEGISDVADTGLPFWGGSVAFRSRARTEILADGAPARDRAEERVRELWTEPLALSSGADAFQRMSYLEMKQRLAEILLMRVDKMMMAWSVEGREPFLEHTLVEFAFAMPAKLKYDGGVGKLSYRSAVSRLLPRAIVDRPKQGFSTPLPAWLRDKLGQRVERDIAESSLVRAGVLDRRSIANLWAQHRSTRSDRSVQLWRLWTLCVWFDARIGASR